MIKNFVFDMGETCLHYEPLKVCRAFTSNETDAELLLHTVYASPEWIMLDRGDFSEDKFIEITSDKLPQRLREAAKESYRVWPEYVLSEVEGMSALITSLKSKGREIYLLSNAAVRLHTYVDKLPAAKCFDGIFVSADEHCLKPSEEIYRRFLERFSLNADECFFIDDRSENITGAEKCGIKGCVFDGDASKLYGIAERLINP